MVSRYKEIREKIQSKFDSLPNNQRKVADFVIDNFDNIPFVDVHEVSKQVGVSVASVIRFAQSVGFTGFSELRDAVSDSLKKHLKKKEIFPLFDKSTLENDLLTSVANMDVKNINDTLSIIDREVFNLVIEEIVQSNRVYTAGLGISYLLAEILSYQLTQVGVDASVLKHTHTLFHEQILYMSKSDLLICFSFPPYSKETVDVAKFAHKNGIKVISITNKSTAPIAASSKAVLTVKSENMLFTNSFAAISVIINAIATACAVKNKAKAKKVLKESEKIMIEQDQVIL
ncbi:Transcriptional regulator [Ignavibacterium album JCM 16511]|uniref:Transcriptional regulator n=1 Tax=Ignavibacterium album (strain DSM 19864 / JCM 16511 / NBRC 101810 / Mat9-16) TaxID=945713 RepID=I0ANQ4_IGNAJ|nr:MurR/RpiR family transcriptional regulator [Ignavibacterium album]AFH50611.1 Transcriptional regulator [Ignavibacterium album JCM 16511]